MSATAAQIVALACQQAKVPGMTSQAGIMLNAILSELCQNYDFETAMGTNTFNFVGVGPYVMPTDYLRTKKNTMIYAIQGVQYVLIQLSYPEYRALVQQAGLQSFPTFFATDPSQSPTNLYVWPPPSGAYTVTQNYYRLMPEITTPESSTDVPWFPYQTYLFRRLAGELMSWSGDERMQSFLGDDDNAYPNGAGTLLRKYLSLKDDTEGYVKQVELDRRMFSRPFNRLPVTKTIGW